MAIKFHFKIIKTKRSVVVDFGRYDQRGGEGEPSALPSARELGSLFLAKFLLHLLYRYLKIQMEKPSPN
jgi:hypothetical protein